MEEVNFNETTETEIVESEKALNCDSNEPKKSKTPAMFKAGIALMCATSALSLGAIGACGFLGYKLYKNQKNKNSNPQDSMGSVVTNKAPTITVSNDGYLVIDGVKTETKITGNDGIAGTDGISVVNASIVKLDKWGITTQIQFKMSDNSYIVTAPQTQIMSEHFYEAEDMSDILTLTEGYGVSKIKLSNNVYLSSSIDFAGDTVIDLNRKSLEYVAINPLKVAENSSLTFKNGAVAFKNSIGVSIQGENAELSFEKVTVSATATVAETLENNASISLTNSTVQTIQQGYGASRSAVGSLFVIKGENANISVSGSKFETTKSIVSASDNATEFKIAIKETKINTTAPILDVNTDEVVPTLDIDNSTMQNSTVTELNTSPITSGTFNVDPTELGATLEGVEQFNVNGSTVLAADLQALVDMIESGSTINLTRSYVLESNIVITKTLTINLGNYTISAPHNTDIAVFKVENEGKLTINASEEGGINSASDSNNYSIAVWARNGGEVIINGGFYTNVGAKSMNGSIFNNNEMIYTSGDGSKITINDGFFMGNFLNERWGTRYTLNKHDSTDSEIVVNGGLFFGYNPAESLSENPVENFVGENKIIASFYTFADLEGAAFEGNVYAVTNSNKFAEIVSEGYTIYEYVDPYNGQTYSEKVPVDAITLNGNVVLERGIVIENRTFTLNLNSYSISAPTSASTALIRVNANGYLTIEGNGTINSASSANDYSIAVWASNGGQVTINGGTFTNVGAKDFEDNGVTPNNNELIYVSGTGSLITINNATIIGNSENKTWGTRYTLNKADRCASEIIVNGGTFVKYDPSMSKSENPIANFVASGHFIINNGDNYTVVAGTLQEVIANAVAGSTITLNGNVEIAGANVDTQEARLYIDKDLTIDLNGYSINGNYGNGNNNFFVFRVRNNATLTINDSKGTGSITAYATTGAYALYVDGGTLVVNAGTITGNPTAVNIYNGKAIINGGTFVSSDEDKRYVINCIDANYRNETALVEINGGTFVDYNPSTTISEGAVANFVTEGRFVVKTGNNYAVVSGSINEVIANAVAGSTITLIGNVEIAGANVDTQEARLYIDKDLTIDLNGYSINGNYGNGDNNFFVFRVRNNATLTINDSKGNGSITAYATTGAYALFVDGGTLVVNAGTITGNPTAVNIYNGKAIINGGTFVSSDEDKRYVINCIDANYRNETALVEINGGTFVDYNPSATISEGAATNFVTEGRFVVKNGNNYAVVAGTLQEVINSAVAGSTIILTEDLTLTAGVLVTKELTLDLAEYVISTPTITELAAIEVNAGGKLTINAGQNGGINSASQNNSCSIAVWGRNGGEAIINGGFYTNVGALSNLGNGKYANNEMIYTSGNGSKITINNGFFVGNHENEKWGTRYTVNKHDSTNSTIIVNGGTFFKYNPAESLSENPVANFVAEGYKVVVDGNFYTVVAE